MSYFAAVLGYLSWLATVAIGYFASEFAIKKFDKKWKAKTEAEEATEG
jgi:hypothetical protein